MSRTIHKYPLRVQEGLQQVSMPMGAVIRFVANQGDVLTMWAEVDRRLPMTPVSICVVGTGWPIPNDHTVYVGTAGIGPFVWHVYRRPQ